jgi:hypothetical protein
MAVGSRRDLEGARRSLAVTTMVFTKERFRIRRSERKKAGGTPRIEAATGAVSVSRAGAVASRRAAVTA